MPLDVENAPQDRAEAVSRSKAYEWSPLPLTCPRFMHSAVRLQTDGGRQAHKAVWRQLKRTCCRVLLPVP